MTITFNLRAATNATFHWTRDFSQIAAAYAVASGVIRMQARTTPAAADPPAYQWVTGATSGGVAAFDPTTNLCVFTAPEADMAGMAGTMPYDCRLELPGGECVPLFAGRIVWTPGVTRTAGDATTETGVSGLGDTVAVDGEVASDPVPLPASITAAIAATQSAQTAASASAADAAGSATTAAGSATAAAASAAMAAQVPTNFGAAFLAWFDTLPTSLPASTGSFWNDGGTLAQS
jgi:hypothetical protein